MKSCIIMENGFTPAAAPLRNVYACLVHERRECVMDLVQNLRHLDHASRILLYDGSQGGNLFDSPLPLPQGVEIHPRPQPMKWGHLHGFAIDCLRYLKSAEPFDVMTVVDSDQLALRAGYTDFLARNLVDRAGLGLLSSVPDRQGPNTRIPPALIAHQERALWRPFLRRFPEGEDKFVHWTFWPSTVITADAGFALLDLFDHDAELARIMGASRLWATEEVLFPTLTALLGFRVERNPCAFDYVQYRKAYGAGDIEAALRRPDAYWMHPVPRRYDDPLRARIRQFHGGYRGLEFSGGMRGSQGGLEDGKTELPANAVREESGSKSGHKAGIGGGCQRGGAMGGLIHFAVDRLVKSTHPKLLALFVPGVEFIRVTRSIFDTARVFMSRLAKFAPAPKSFIHSVMVIAFGVLGKLRGTINKVLDALIN